MTSIHSPHRIIHNAGQDGINKLVTTFLATHEGVSKRQAEIKINELAVKEKRPEDKYIIWHIRPEFERYLHMTSSEAAAAGAAAAGASATSSAAANGAAEVGASSKKRKKEETDDADGGDAPTPNGGAHSNGNGSAAAAATAKEPKKYKRALGYFVKAKRAEAAEQLGDAAVVSEIVRVLCELYFSSIFVLFGVSICRLLRFATPSAIM